VTTRGLVLAAPSSGAGKTVLSLAVMRALRDRGHSVAAAKSGPDYIDPRFHQAALGAPSQTLDAWAMSVGDLRARVGGLPSGKLLVVEGAMGALDGAPPDGRGSSADLAEALGAPVVMILDVSRMAQSAALPLAGFRALRPGLTVAGAVLNRVGSERHERMARRALEAAGFEVFGAVPRDARLDLPSRHLGLVQAEEHADLSTFIASAAEIVAASLDLDRLAAAAAALEIEGERRPTPPLGARIAVASDTAFAFAYPHMLDDWRSAGAEIRTFSPLRDEGPDAEADSVFLPGGYPELHAGRLSAAAGFRRRMQQAAARGAVIYGECGGFMALGEGLIDAHGARWSMLGLVPLETSFADRKRALGYRRLSPLEGVPWSIELAGHEHHQATITAEGRAPRLFAARDAEGQDLGPIGLRVGSVMGSFAHVIGRSAP